MGRGMTKARFFDAVAENGLWQDFAPRDGPKVKRLLDRLNLAPGMTVLEPGCGTGRLTVHVLDRVRPGGRIIANDISPRMIAAARRRRLGRGMRWHVGPAEAVRVRDESVDRVVCFQSFPHFDDKLAALRLFRRALKPDGLLAIVHFAGRREINRIHRQESEPICRDLVPTKREMQSLLRASKFRLEELEDSSGGYWLFARPI